MLTLEERVASLQDQTLKTVRDMFRVAFGESGSDRLAVAVVLLRGVADDLDDVGALLAQEGGAPRLRVLEGGRV